ncbi:hypothetical protein [Pontibacillus sp. ALD_SL1]|nr:hypothetical protein [Pontibacillus sp. ALD_SL1]
MIERIDTICLKVKDVERSTVTGCKFAILNKRISFFTYEWQV